MCMTDHIPAVMSRLGVVLRPARPGRGLWLILQLCGALTAAPPSIVMAESTGGALPKLESVAQAPEPTGSAYVTWSHDGTKLAAYNAFGSLIEIIKNDGTIIRQIPRNSGLNVDGVLAFLQGDTALVGLPQTYSHSGDVSFSIYDAATGRVLQNISGPFPGKSGAVNTASALTVSPDQAVAAVIYGRGEVHPVELYNTLDWQRLGPLNGSAHDGRDAAISLAFSPDGNHIGVGQVAGHVLIFNAANRLLERNISAFPDVPDTPILSVVFSPDGSAIAVGAARHASALGFDGEGGRYGRFTPIKVNTPVRIFRLSDGHLSGAIPGFLEPIRSMAWDPRGRFLAFIARDDALHIWDPDGSGASYVVQLGGAAMSVAISPDGSLLAACAGTHLTLFRVNRK